MRISSKPHFFFILNYTLRPRFENEPWATHLNFSVTDSLTEELACKYHNHVSLYYVHHVTIPRGEVLTRTFIYI